MSKNTDIWFPFYIGDYVADTMHLSAEEHGAYLLLIIHYWKNQKPIKNDPKTIQNIAKIKFKKLSNVLAFFEEKEGCFTHRRIQREIEKAITNKELKSKAGKISANKRYNKKLTDVATKPQQTGQQKANPSPSPSPFEDKSSKQKIQFKDFDVKVFFDDGYKNTWKKTFPLPDGQARDVYVFADIFNENVNSGRLGKPDKPCAAFMGWSKNYFQKELNAQLQ